MAQSTKPVILGRSVEGRLIHAYVQPAAGMCHTIILGGIHGDEPKSVYVARRLLELLLADDDRRPEGWAVAPLINPDGYERRRRRNSNGVDINRNFPTDNWVPGKRRSRMFGGDVAGGEPETKAVIRLLERCQPTRIVTIHSIGRHRYCNNYDGPGKALAGAVARLNRYPVTASLGYPTPGSFGTWAGVERRIATVTLELPSHHSPKRCWEDNREALSRLIRRPPRLMPT